MMIKNMKALLHVGAIGIMLSVGAMGGANLAFAHGGHGGDGHSGSVSSMSSGGSHGGSGMRGGDGGDHHHPIGVFPGMLIPPSSGSSGTEGDASGLPVTCGHVYTTHSVIGPRTCVATRY